MYVDILLLAELTTGPKHGYEIKKNVQNRLGEITETGEEIFSEMLREFPEKLATNNTEFLVRIALFEKLDYEDRKEILTVRQNVLHNQLTAIQSLDVTSSFITEVIEFSKSRIEHELSWITSLMKKI